MKVNPRILELCERLASPGHCPSKLSASEFHEIAEYIFDLNGQPETDTERLNILQNLLGSCRQATEVDVHIFEDDATHTIHVKAGKESYWGHSLRDALDKVL